MFEISVNQHFDAAHFLRNYHGKCEALHGHRYEVRVTLKASELDEAGMAYDFLELKKQLGSIIYRFDHTCLNDVPPFDKLNPSAENIATTIFHELKPRLVDTVTLSLVEVWESPENRAAYIPD